MRNGYLMAVAPNSTTAMIAGSTASIDPVFKTFYSEEKKDFRIPTTAPDLDHHTYEIYRRSAYIVDQRWSVRQNAARQKHIEIGRASCRKRLYGCTIYACDKR